MNEIDILKKKFIGNYYTRFSVGDTFDYYFDGFWLMSQNIISPDEEFLNKVLSKYQPTEEAVDKMDMAKSFISCCTLRKKITELSLAKDSTLILTFENKVEFSFPTNTEIVDWHWVINEKGNDPYFGFMVGCFSPGIVELGGC
jgi:hypothetical protein